MIPYEILIRGNADGTLSGCHVIDKVGGDARPVTAEDLKDIAPDFNVAALAEADALKPFKALNDTMTARVSEVLASGDPAQYEALAKEFLTPAKEKERQAALAELEAAQARVDALEA